MTFEQGLIASGYYYQPECGCYLKNDSSGNVHTYVEQQENTWSYEKYDANDKVLTTKVFSL